MFNQLAIAGVALSLLATPLSSDPTTAPPTGKVTVSVQTVNGSGCPAGTVAVATAPDNTAFTVTYSDYTAQVGPSAAATDRRKNCQMNLLVHVPQGFTYAIQQVDLRGYAFLAKGASALEQASYYFTGTSPTAYIKHTLNGPMDDNWQNTDATEMASLVFAPCGVDRNLNVNTELRVSPGSSGGAASFISMDSTDGSFSTIYHFAWKQC